MIEVVGIRFKSGGKTYFFDPSGMEIEEGQDVIIETSRGIEYGTCCESNHEVADEAVVQPLRPVIRIATDEDRRTVEENRKKEERAFQVCEEKIADHQLDMKLVDVECNFEGNKILFFFTSDGRVDFRELVKDLAGVFRTRIELRQIGVRDEAKLLGGLGICGRPFCCSTFLDDFQPVSIKMAKTQNLSLNPTKISGTCGRLMCCLKYEQDAYEDLVKRLPKVNALVDTPDGPAVVAEVNMLRETVKVKREDIIDKRLYRYDGETKSCTPVEERRESDYFSDISVLSRLSELSHIEEPEAEPQQAQTDSEPKAEEHRSKSSRSRNKRKSSRGKSESQQTKPKETAPAKAESKTESEHAHSKSGKSRKKHRGGSRSGERRAPAAEQSKQNHGASGEAAKQQGGKSPKPEAKQNALKPAAKQPEHEGSKSGSSPSRRKHNKYKGRAANRPPKDKPAAEN